MGHYLGTHCVYVLCKERKQKATYMHTHKILYD